MTDAETKKPEVFNGRNSPDRGMARFMGFISAHFNVNLPDGTQCDADGLPDYFMKEASGAECYDSNGSEVDFWFGTSKDDCGFVIISYEREYKNGVSWEEKKFKVCGHASKDIFVLKSIVEVE